MNDSRIAFKVGVFVFVGAALIALLILNFSKGATLGRSTYTLRVVLPNAAGLKPSADVMMAGVAVGKVTDMKLAEDIKSVDITVKIISSYNKIPKDSQFRVENLGFLGDQYVSIVAPAENGLSRTNEIEYLKNGDTVIGEAQFNVLEAVQSVSGLLNQAKKAVKDLDQAITNVNASALSSETLAHFVMAISNLQVVSERAASAAARAEDLLATNSDAFHVAVDNFEILSGRLTNTAEQLDDIVVNNREDIRTAVKNLTVASDKIKQVATDVQAGKGPVGDLLKDDKMTAQLQSIVSNADAISAEFSTFGSNLNQRGIWAMLWKPKQKETNAPPANRIKVRP